MPFINSDGRKISYECSELIEELTDDIAEFGKDLEIYAWCRNAQGVTLYTNYDFASEGRIKSDELLKGEYLKRMTAGKLLELLKEQNKFM